MISLIIAYYKRLDFLKLIFQSLEKQSFRDFEVIIAEDNNEPVTAEFVTRARSLQSFRIVHLSQEDTGFRKNRILNAAVIASSGEKLVFIDGDCILHRHHLEEYNKAIAEGRYCYGRRVYCSEKHTRMMLASGSIEKCNFLSAILYGGRNTGSGFYLPFKFKPDRQSRTILGCNWGVLKKDLIAVNGFDEDYNKAAVGEDLDIDWRLKKYGLRTRSVKGRAIVFHLDHGPNYSDSDPEYGKQMMAAKIAAGNVFCLNGIKENHKQDLKTL